MVEAGLEGRYHVACRFELRVYAVAVDHQQHLNLCVHLQQLGLHAAQQKTQNTQQVIPVYLVTLVSLEQLVELVDIVAYLLLEVL